MAVLVVLVARDEVDRLAAGCLRVLLVEEVFCRVATPRPRYSAAPTAARHWPSDACSDLEGSSGLEHHRDDHRPPSGAIGDEPTRGAAHRPFESGHVSVVGERLVDRGANPLAELLEQLARLGLVDPAAGGGLGTGHEAPLLSVVPGTRLST